MKKNKYLIYSSIFVSSLIVGSIIPTVYIIKNQNNKNLNLNFLANENIKIDESIINNSTKDKNIFDIFSKKIHSIKKYSSYDVKYYPFGSSIEDIKNGVINEISLTNNKHINWHFNIALFRNGNPVYLYSYINEKLSNIVFKKINLNDSFKKKVFIVNSNNPDEDIDYTSILNNFDNEMNLLLKNNFDKIILSLMTNEMINDVNNFGLEDMTFDFFSNNQNLINEVSIESNKIIFKDNASLILQKIGFKNIVNGVFESDIIRRITPKLSNIKDSLQEFKFDGKDNEFIYEMSDKFQPTNKVKDLTDSLSKYFTNLLVDLYKPTFLSNEMLEKGIFDIQAAKSYDLKNKYSSTDILNNVWGSGSKKPYIWFDLSKIRDEFKEELSDYIDLSNLSTGAISIHIDNPNWKEMFTLNKKTVDKSLEDVLNNSEKEKNEFRIKTNELTMDNTVKDFLNFVSTYITKQLKSKNPNDLSFLTDEMIKNGIFNIENGYKKYDLSNENKWDINATLSTVWGNGDNQPHMWLKLENIKEEYRKIINDNILFDNDFQAMNFYVKLGEE